CVHVDVLSEMMTRRRLSELALRLGALGGGLTAGLIGAGRLAGTSRSAQLESARLESARLGAAPLGSAKNGVPLGVPPGGPPRGRELEHVALWAADRAGHALYGLATDGAVLQRVEIDAPLEVRPSPGPGCLVLSALDRCRAGPTRWLEWTGSGLQDVPEGSRPVSPGERAPFQRRPREALTIRPEATGNGAWVLRGTSEPGSTSSGSTSSGTTSSDTIPFGLIERWERVMGGQDGWVQRSSWPLPFAARALAPIDGGVWVAGYRVAVARKVARSGAVLREVALEGSDGVEDALAIPPRLGGGVWLAACGALVRLDGRGRRQPGQGGFAHLVSLAGGNPR
ncbi:hypothetical protein N9185_00420, partial [bacterium]|nr:hypothetical protein [bacterium]